MFYIIVPTGGGRITKTTFRHEPEYSTSYITIYFKSRIVIFCLPLCYISIHHRSCQSKVYNLKSSRLLSICQDRRNTIFVNAFRRIMSISGFETHSWFRSARHWSHVNNLSWSYSVLVLSILYWAKIIILKLISNIIYYILLLFHE